MVNAITNNWWIVLAGIIVGYLVVPRLLAVLRARKGE